MYLLAACFTGLSITLISYRDAIIEKWGKFKELYSFVSKRYDSPITSLRITLQTIVQMYIDNFTQWLNSSRNSNVVQIDNKHWVLTYVFNGKTFKIVLKPKKGPVSITKVTDETGEELSSEILPFYGPAQDWHNKRFSPSFWKKDQLVFDLSTGERKVFTGNEEIVI